MYLLSVYIHFLYCYQYIPNLYSVDVLEHPQRYNILAFCIHKMVLAGRFNSLRCSDVFLCTSPLQVIINSFMSTLFRCNMSLICLAKAWCSDQEAPIRQEVIGGNYERQNYHRPEIVHGLQFKIKVFVLRKLFREPSRSVVISRDSDFHDCGGTLPLTEKR